MVLPNDLSAEAAIISAMMIDELSIIKAIEKLETKDFFDVRCQTIFIAICDMFNNNEVIDQITLINKLIENKGLNRAGKEVFINEVSDVVMSGSNIDYHIKIVLEKSKLRTLIEKSNKIIIACQNQNESTEDIIDSAQKTMLAIGNTKQKPFFTAQEVCQRAMNVIEYRMTEEYNKSKLISGIEELDDYVQLEPGQIMIIDGRTSNGKTVLALQYAMINCIERNKKVAVFTMEMMVEYLAFREIARSSANNSYYSNQISHRTVKYPKSATEDQTKIISEIIENMSEKSFIFDHTSNQTGQQILAKCMQIKHLLSGLDLVVVDYLQLMKSTETKSREQQVSEFSKALKIIATNLEVPVIGLSQVNRDGLARESDAIQHDTDVRLSVFIPRNNDQLEGRSVWVGGRKMEFEDIPENLGIIKVKKNRHGTLSHDILCEFDGDHQCFKKWDGML